VNDDDKAPLMIVIGLILAVLLFGGGGKKSDPKPGGNGPDAIAYKAVKQFAAALSEIADESAGMDSNKAVKLVHEKVIPAFDEAWLPINERVDQAVEDGDFGPTMRKIATGYKRASK
jgi:hypothetical protein